MGKQNLGAKKHGIKFINIFCMPIDSLNSLNQENTEYDSGFVFNKTTYIINKNDCYFDIKMMNLQTFKLVSFHININVNFDGETKNSQNSCISLWFVMCQPLEQKKKKRWARERPRLKTMWI